MKHSDRYQGERERNPEDPPRRIVLTLEPHKKSQVDRRASDRVDDVIQPLTCRARPAGEPGDLPISRVEQVSDGQQNSHNDTHRHRGLGHDEQRDGDGREHGAGSRNGIWRHPESECGRCGVPGDPTVDPPGVGRYSGPWLLGQLQLVDNCPMLRHHHCTSDQSASSTRLCMIGGRHIAGMVLRSSLPAM
jgi:hypothetical protein